MSRSILVSVPLLFACSGGGAADESSSEAVDGPTYRTDAAPVLQTRCATCHQPGDIGPFPLTTYEEVKAVEAAVRSSLENGTMPPWQPADDCAEYIGNYDLTPDERDLLLAWLDAGAPEGDTGEPIAEAEAEPVAPSWEANHSLKLPEPYTPVLEPDDYRCQLIPWPEDEVSYVTGFRVVPDQREIVHHTIGFLVGPDQVEQYQAYDAAEEGPGYTCYGGPAASTDGGLFGSMDPAEVLAAMSEVGLSITDFQDGTVTPEELAALFEELGVSETASGFSSLGSWVPGAADLPLPEGTGLRVEPGSLLVVQMHYNTLSADPVPDQSTIEIATTDQVERQATSVAGIDLGWVSDGMLGDAMTIPAGDPEVAHSTTITYDSIFVQNALHTLGLEDGSPLLIHSANHHMHELGTSQLSEVFHEDGSSSCLLDNPDWDFSWQGTYQLAEPVRLGPGDEIQMSCTWDNSAANQPIVEGEAREPTDVSWGEGTEDEMCLGSYYVTAP